MSKNVKGVPPGTMTADDDAMPLYDLDPAKAKPNRFAHREKIIVGARGGVRKGAGRKPAAEPAERHTVTLYQSDVRTLRKLDPNLSRAIRKLLRRA